MTPWRCACRVRPACADLAACPVVAAALAPGGGKQDCQAALNAMEKAWMAQEPANVARTRRLARDAAAVQRSGAARTPENHERVNAYQRRWYAARKAGNGESGNVR